MKCYDDGFRAWQSDPPLKRNSYKMHLNTKVSADHRQKICTKMLTFAIILGVLSGSLAFDYKTIVDLDTPQMIKLYGYPVEKHKVTTEDGYILTIFRIPHGKNSEDSFEKRPPVVLQHGLLCSSDDWLLSGPERSLAIRLVEEGYDVYLPNIRGNRYSRHHTSLTTNDTKYWSFSWDESGRYDIPAIIDYVLVKTGLEKLIYIGHSMGTTMFYVMASLRPEYCNKTKLMVSLAPIAHMGNMMSPFLQLLSGASLPAGALMKLMGANEFTPSQELMKILGDTLCDKLPASPLICKNILFLVCGFDPDQLDEGMLPVIMAHTPAGSSCSQMLHYGQEIADGKFKRYDHGLYNNLKKYQSAIPPNYPLEKITTPVALMYGENDWLAGLKDIDKLYLRLPNCVEKYKVPFKKFNHIDFMYAKDIKTLLYDRLFALLREYA